MCKRLIKLVKRYADIVLMIKGREMNGHTELKRRTDTRITKTSFIRIEYAAV